MNQEAWQNWRVIITVAVGAFALVVGVLRSDAAMMTVGAGLVGFSPAAKGP